MSIFSKCDQILNSGRNAALATIVEASAGTPGKPGFKLVLADDGELFGTVGGGALENKTIEEAREVLATRRGRIFPIQTWTTHDAKDSSHVMQIFITI